MTRSRSVSVRGLCVALGLLVLTANATGADADDAYYRIPLRDLKTEGKIPVAPDAGGSRLVDRWQPQVRLDGADVSSEEAYITYQGAGWPSWNWAGALAAEGTDLVIRAPAGKAVSGRLLVPAEDLKSLVPVRFTVPAGAVDPKARDAFFVGKQRHYEALLREGIPGAAWFRHQAREALAARGGNGDVNNRVPPNAARGDLEDTYSLFSGGRALSENLQLDRVLAPRAAGDEPTIAIDTLEGITIKEMDWKPLVAGKHPATDPLAAMIPVDQHAIFFPTFDAAMTVIDEADRQGTPVLQLAEPRSEDARTKERYQRQMCLSLTGIGRLLGPRVINSVAVTGSDPYLRVGTDVAILFEAKDAGALRGLLAAQMGLANAAGGGPNAAQSAVSGKINEIPYSGFVTSDRRVSAYLASIGNTVIVTNSLAQLQRLADVQSGKSPALATAPEYTFFRDRYVRGEGDEAALVVLTDATIRRWCSAKWRIADSRRTRAAAAMAELQANVLGDLVTGKAQVGQAVGLAEGTEVLLTPNGVTSAMYGNLEFMTPIIEMDLSHVTQAEADMYHRWRDTYQQNWRNYFDPIAIRFVATPNKLAADLTVMPLIAGTEYGEIIAISRGAKILPGTGDPHDALLHLALAININSDRMKQLGGMASIFAPQLKVDPLSWLGQTLAVYIDDDPIWQEAAKAEHPEDFLQKHIDRLPIAAYLESTSVMKLTLFLTGLHAFIDQSAPGMSNWEPMKYNEWSYVKISPTAQAKADTRELESAAIYYTTAGGALLITPNEALLKRALDRQALARGCGHAAGGAGIHPPRFNSAHIGCPGVARRQLLRPRPTPHRDPVDHWDFFQQLRVRTPETGVGQSAHPQRMEAAISRPRPGCAPRNALADPPD